MKAIAQNKLTKKLLLLIILAGALVYLRTPPQAQAIDCCEELLQACDAQCHGNKTCMNNCFATYVICTSGVIGCVLQ
jgi:hypothetical protein